MESPSFLTSSPSTSLLKEDLVFIAISYSHGCALYSALRNTAAKAGMIPYTKEINSLLIIQSFINNIC